MHKEELTGYGFSANGGSSFTDEGGLPNKARPGRGFRTYRSCRARQTSHRRGADDTVAGWSFETAAPAHLARRLASSAVPPVAFAGLAIPLPRCRRVDPRADRVACPAERADANRRDPAGRTYSALWHGGGADRRAADLFRDHRQALRAQYRYPAVDHAPR